MGLTHMRKPKNFVLEDRLERYARAIETHPAHYRSRWADATSPLDGSRPLRAVALDLGCGKGSYLVEAARRDPMTLFIGMDVEPVCIAYAAQRICESELANALVIPRGAGALGQIFGAGELDAITLNFPTPYPKRHFAQRRLTNVDHLLAYRPLLAPRATVTLRTDSQPLRDFTLTQIKAAGYKLLWASDDVRRDHPEHPQTEYESRLVEQGAAVWGLCITPTSTPTDQLDRDAIAHARNQEQSLVSYLPDDLERLTYVPLGMEAAVTNLINRRRRERERAQRHAGAR